jgi:hypothetical protein
VAPKATTGKDAPVKVVGLDDLQRDLKRVSPELERLVDAGGLDQISDRVAAEARNRAVKRTGKYAASIVRLPSPDGGSTVGSKLPQAGVLHWGGVIRPRGVDITFPRRPVISEAADRLAPQVVDQVGELLEQAAHRAGWKR